MKKIILSFILLLATASCFAESEKTQASTIQVINISDSQKLVPVKEHEENRNQYYVIDYTFPQIIGNNLSANEEQFNTYVKEMALQEVNQFKKYIAADMPHMQTLPEEVRNNNLRIDYDADAIKPDKNIILSVRLSIEGFQAGRAHPYHNHRSLNFDLADGKILTLSELFKPRSKYLDLIAKYSNKKLNETLEDKWMIADGTKPIPKNYQIWNIQENGLLFTFEEYQVAAYVYGAQEVEVPYDALKTVISPTAVIYACVQNVKGCETT